MHLSERGEARARALVTLFAGEPVLGTNGPPAALFAPKSTRHGHTTRPSETLMPLAQHLKLSLRTLYGPSEYAALAKQIMADSAFDGKTIIICWIHEYLPALAKAFGVNPEPARWKGSVYDRVWVITYEDHRAHLADLPQHLLPGDSTN